MDVFGADMHVDPKAGILDALQSKLSGTNRLLGGLEGLPTAYDPMPFDSSANLHTANVPEGATSGPAERTGIPEPKVLVGMTGEDGNTDISYFKPSLSQIADPGNPTWRDRLRAFAQGAFDAVATPEQLAAVRGVGDTFTAQQRGKAAKKGSPAAGRDVEALDKGITYQGSTPEAIRAPLGKPMANNIPERRKPIYDRRSPFDKINHYNMPGRNTT